MLHGSHRLMPPCNFFDCSMPQLRSRTNDFSISRNLWLMWTSSMPPKKQTKARQFSVLHLSQISLTKNFEGGILAQFHRMSPRGDSPKRLLCRNSTVQRHLWTGQVYCQPHQKSRKLRLLLVSTTEIQQGVWLYALAPGLSLDHSPNDSQSPTSRTTCRAFSATAQIESDAIKAGLTYPETILSAQQITKW